MTAGQFFALWNDDTPHIEARTSGSTGTPKTIMLAKSDMRASALATNAFFGINAGSLLASPLSPDYIAGKMMLVRAAVAGCRMVQLPVQNHITVPDGLPVIDLLPIVPSQIGSLLTQPRLAPRIRNLLIGGAAPSADDCRRLAECGYNAFVSYGMTETCSHVALARADDRQRTFVAMPGIRFSADNEGKLIIDAPHFSFGRLVTNDIVDLVDSRSFRWRGRADNVINSGGIKFFAEELETEYRPYLPEMAFMVRPCTHPVWGQAVELVIESTDPATVSIAESALRQAGINSRRLPKKITLTSSLPRTSNGKLRRR